VYIFNVRDRSEYRFSNAHIFGVFFQLKCEEFRNNGIAIPPVLPTVTATNETFSYRRTSVSFLY
jgi:hypothetical protein